MEEAVESEVKREDDANANANVAPSSHDNQPGSLSHAADAPPLTSAPIITRADIKTKLYEILAKVDVTVVSERQIREMVSTELNGLDMKQHKDFVRKHCMHVVTFMQEPGAVMSDLQPLDDNEEDEVKKEGKEEDGEKASKRKKVQGKKRKGEEEDGDWEEDVDKMKKGSSKKKRPRKESSSSLKASVEDVEKDQRGEEDEEGDEDEERGSLKGPRAKPSVSKAPREKKPRKARSSAAAAAVEKMDQPGGLGEYDPRRAEQELLRRLDARQDIKAAHKACLHASNGNLAPLLELIEAANDTEGGADSASRLYLVEAISQAGKEAIGAISASHPIITALSAWSLEALDESLRGLGGAWVVTESQRLIDAIATLLMKMPFSLRAQLEALRSSGLIESMKRVASESKLQSATRDQVLSWLHKWEPLSKPSGAAAPPSSQLPPPLRPSSASSKPHSSLHDFLPSFLQPTPLSSSAAAKVGVSANNNVKNTTNGSVGGSGGALRTGPVVAPAAGTALSELEKKKKLAEELAKKKKRLEREAAKKIQALPKMASFEDYQKKKQEKKSTKHPLTSTAAAADMIPPAPASGTGTSTGAGTGTGTGKASTSLSSGPTSASIIAQSSSSDEELQVVIRFVKKHLVPLVESGSLSKHDYKSIKDKVVKKVAEGNKAKGWTMDAEFFSTRSEKGKEQADKVVKLIEGYVAAASASASAAGGRSLREKSKK